MSKAPPRAASAAPPPPAPDGPLRAAAAAITVTPAAERKFVAYIAAAALLLAALASLLGFALSQPGYRFVGQVYNIDDTAVYYSWIRQAADGHFFARNLFTTDPQHAIQFNSLMLLLGAVERVTRVPIPALYTAARLLFAALLLVAVWTLYRLLAPRNAVARMASFAFACLGGGFGWAYWPRWSSDNNTRLPVDTWQPEALLFPSMEMSAIFTFSLILIVSVIVLLVSAQRTGRMRYAVGAGACALVLGNVHSYDIVPLAAAWLAYLVATGLVERRLDGGSWAQALVCGLIALPAPLYQLHVFQADPVFHARVLTATASPPVIEYVLGFGAMLLLALAAVAVWSIGRFAGVTEQLHDRRAAILAICWFGAGLAMSYAPLSFQRKMIMGADVPLCLLAGCGLAALLQRLKAPSLRAVAVAACAALALPSSLLFVERDVRHVKQDRSETLSLPFLTAGESDALGYLRHDTPPGSACLALPTFALFVPGYCDRATYVGHWGETPDYATRYGALLRLIHQTGLPPDALAGSLRGARVRYLVFPTPPELNGMIDTTGLIDFDRYPGLLTPVHVNRELTVYRLDLPPSAE